MAEYLDKNGLQHFSEEYWDKIGEKFATKAMVGSPLVAQTAADMTDTGKVYVYTGSETGYVNGDWYYYDGSAWQDGGVYNSAAVVLDDTLTQPDEAAEAKAVGDALANKANIDGSYADLTAGNAEALVTNLSETSLTPYNFQTTGGSVETGNRVNIKKVIYGSVVINQLCDHGNFDADTGWSVNRGTFSVSGNKGTFTAGSDVAGSSYISRSIGASNKIAGHKYFVSAIVKPSANTAIGLRLFGTNLTGISVSANERKRVCGIINYTTTSAENTFLVYVNNGGGHLSEGDTVEIENAMVIDITKWYGSTETAGHIYLMESASTGRGVSFMQTQYPVLNGGYIPYNTGTLLSSNPSKHEANGFNWWNEEWELGSYNNDGQPTSSNQIIRNKTPIKVLPSTEYYANLATKNARIFYYDISGAFISYYDRTGDGTFTTPANCYFINFGMNTAYGTTYKGDICFSDHWDDTRNGDYEAWVLHSYPIDNTVDGHGIFKFKPQAASPWTYTDHLTDEMYVDGDELIPDGTLTTNYKVYTLNGDTPESAIGVNSFSEYGYTRITYTQYANEGVANVPFISDRFVFAQKSDANGSVGEMKNSSSGPRMFILVPSTVTTKAEAITWFASNPTTIYAPIATPTTSQKDPYQETMIVDNWGWEFLNDYAYDNGNRAVQIPVGNESVYPVNLVDKLEAAPDNPTADGFYIVKKNGNSTEYVAYVGELPSDPASDGTYTLKATVSSGSVTKSWVADA